MTDVRYDPLSPEVHQDPYRIYSALRRHAPLYRSESGWYALSRYDDVRRALQQTRDFSSSAMHDLVLAVGNDNPGEGPRTLIGTDPPDHTSIRKIVNRGFTRRRIAELESRIRAMSEDLVAPIVSRGGGDLVADLAAALPVMVIAEMLGIDPARRVDFRRWSDDLMLVLGGRATPAQVKQSELSLDAMGDYLSEIIEERKRVPKDDLISALVQNADDEEGVLVEEEARFFAELLLIAGNETTTYLLSNAIHALLSHPDQLDLVAERPDLIPNVIEETLRHSSPIQLTMRRATRDLKTPHGVIPEGSSVLLLLASANRDDSVFPRAARFDMTRDTSGHLAFGHGTHFCLGSALARLEARVALEVLFEQASELRLLDRVPQHQTLLLRGAGELKVALTQRLSNVPTAAPELVRRSA
jgi:cytochrome P450